MEDWLDEYRVLLGNLGERLSHFPNVSVYRYCDNLQVVITERTDPILVVLIRGIILEFHRDVEESSRRFDERTLPKPFAR